MAGLVSCGDHMLPLLPSQPPPDPSQGANDWLNALESFTRFFDYPIPVLTQWLNEDGFLETNGKWQLSLLVSVAM